MRPNSDVLKVKVVGSGGIGLSLLPNLLRVLNYSCGSYGYEDAEIDLIDGDTFEERNRDRQAFSERGNKAEATIERFRSEFPNLPMKAVPEYVTEDNLPQLISDGDVVFLCVDNHKTRNMISRYCEKLDNVTIISGGNDYHDGSCQVYIRRDGVDRLLPIHADVDGEGKVYHPEIGTPNDKHPNEIKKREGCLELQATSPQLLIANNMAAALMLNTLHGLLTGVFEEDGVQKIFKYTQVFFDCRSNVSRADHRPVRSA